MDWWVRQKTKSVVSYTPGQERGMAWANVSNNAFGQINEDGSLTDDLTTWWSLMTFLRVLHFCAVLKGRNMHDIKGLGIRVNRKRVIGSNQYRHLFLGTLLESGADKWIGYWQDMCDQVGALFLFVFKMGESLTCSNMLIIITLKRGEIWWHKEPRG